MSAAFPFDQLCRQMTSVFHPILSSFGATCFVFYDILVKSEHDKHMQSCFLTSLFLAIEMYALFFLC